MFAGQSRFRHRLGTTFVATERGRVLGYATDVAGSLEDSRPRVEWIGARACVIVVAARAPAREPAPAPATTAPRRFTPMVRPPSGDPIARVMPSLIVFKGENLWRVIPLADHDVSLGRREDADVLLDHPSISRNHARIRVESGVYSVVDEGSTNGILVNGKRERRATLGHGDSVQVGVFRLHFHDEPVKPLHDATVAVPAEELARVQESYRRLDGLFTLCTEFTSLVDTQKLLEKLVLALQDVLGAERAIVLLHASAGRKMRPVLCRGIESLDSLPPMARSLVQSAGQSRQAVVVADAASDARTAATPSAARGGIASVIVLPLVSGDQLAGIVYLDARMVSRALLPDDEKRLASFSRMAAGLVGATQERDRLRRDLVCLRTLSGAESAKGDAFAGIIGTSAAAKSVMDQARAAARQDVTTLLLGESGTGKELVARAIHMASRRRERPFVAVNCMALAPEVIESELFGHEKGAFTGAADRRVGRFELADGGTIFLDEIGEIAQPIQVKLLRVLQERSIERVGSAEPVDIDVRVVGATHRDLGALVGSGAFREDLYYRVNVMTIELPPLRDRKEDIPLLIDHYVTHFNAQMGRKIQGVNREAAAALVSYRWSGNIRELRNVIERAFVIETEDQIRLESLPFNLLKAIGQGPARVSADAMDGYPRTYAKARATFERAFLLAALRRHEGSVSSAAREMEVPRKSLYRKLDESGIDIDQISQAQALTERRQIQDALEKHGGNISAVSEELGIPRARIYRKLGRQGASRGEPAGGPGSKPAGGTEDTDD